MATVYACLDVPAPADPAACTAWTAEAYEPSPFWLSVSDAKSIGSSIAILWAVAYVIRLLARFTREVQ